MPELIYLSGAPGVGKSSLMAELTRGLHRLSQALPFAHDELITDEGLRAVERGEWRPELTVAVELGRRRDDFSGTDALGMGVSPRAKQWISERPYDLVLGEGDRLATRGFLGAAQASGYVVHLVHLSAPSATLDQRCAARGSKQNETWRKGRTTKAANLAARAALEGWHLIRLDTSLVTTEQAATALRRAIIALDRLGGQ